MKKILALLLAVTLCFIFCACESKEPEATWMLTPTVDEFGDVTDDSVDIITGTFKGTFSNTATAESDLTVVVSIAKKAVFNHYLVGFDLKEYNNTNATYLSSDSKEFKMKIGEEIITMDLDGEHPNGTLYLSAENYAWEGDLLFNELLKGNDVRCIINIGSSEYNFTLISDNFTTLCSENNIPAGITELTVAEAVNILLDNEEEGLLVSAEDCIKSNLEKFELLNTNALIENLDGLFLEIQTGYFYVDNKVFNVWNLYDYSPDTDKITFICKYGANKQDERYIDAVYNKEINASFENDIITEIFEDSSFEYQCRKISEDIFALSIFSEGNYEYTSLLLKANGDNIKEYVKHMKNNYLSKIEF